MEIPNSSSSRIPHSDYSKHYKAVAYKEVVVMTALLYLNTFHSARFPLGNDIRTI